VSTADWTFGGTWPYEPRFFTTSDGIHIYYVDEGARDRQPVVMLHGNPTWAYLYRHLIRGLTEAGFRAVAHDEMGFGRSDKPERESEYTIQRHAEHFAELMDELRLDGVTLVLQDWGGPIGLAWAVDHPERVRRLVLLNTFTGWIPPEMGKVPLLFKLLRAKDTGELLVKRLHAFVRVFVFKGGRPLDGNAKAAYLAPHPTPASRAGVLAYPRLIPWDEGNPTRPLGRHVEDNLSKLDGKPTLMCWPMKDPGFGREEILQGMAARFPGAEVHRFADASHCIQEDAHERLVPLLVDWLRRT